MKQNELLTILNEIGLDENESRVYLASLSLGPTTVQKIARVAEVKRTTVYSDIESLQKKGLMHIETKGFKKSYVAESPEKLETVLELRRERFHKLLPEFSALYNLKGGESFVKYYDGLEAVKNVYEQLLADAKPREDYLVISDTSKWSRLDQKYFDHFRMRRAKLNLKVRMLLEDSELSRRDYTMQKQLNSLIKFLPEGTSLIANLIITPRKFVIHQLANPIMAIVIENQSIIGMQKQLFDIIWDSISDSK